MKKVLLWVGIALIVIAIIAAIGGGGGKKEQTDKGGQPISTSKPSAKTEAETKSETIENKIAKVGEALTVGEVKWVAGSPEKTAEIESGNQFISPAKANGVFIVVPLTAELIGKESGTIDSSQLAIVDSNGRKFKPTENAEVFTILGDASIFLKQVNPNVPVNGKAVFDVAPDATGLKLEIKDLRLLSNEKGYIDLGL